MRYPLIFLIPLFFLITCCNSNKKDNTKTTTVKLSKGIDTLSIYNDIFNDLVSNYLYDRYLGKDGEEALIEFLQKKTDSATYQTHIDVLKSEVQLQDSLKEVLYLNERITEVSLNKLNFINYPDDAEIDRLKLRMDLNTKPSIDFLDIESNLVKIESIVKLEPLDLKPFTVGKLAFSGLYLNKKQTYGVIFFSFICGQKCGEDSIILIQKSNTKWRIKKKYLMLAI